MPNWAYNLIKFNSEEDLLKVIKTFNPKCFATRVTNLKPKDFDFNLIIPYPKTKKECIEKYGKKYINDNSDSWFNWYDWSCDFWGTKWNCSEVTFFDDNYLYFETAWSPAVPIYKAMALKLPDVNFVAKYAEEQVFAYAGTYYHLNEKGYENYLEEYKTEDEIVKTYNEVVGESFFKLEDGCWHSDYEDCTFYGDDGELHYFDFDSKFPSLSLAKKYHEEQRNSFDKELIQKLEKENPLFLKEAIGFVREVEDFDGTPSKKYEVDIYE